MNQLPIYSTIKLNSPPSLILVLTNLVIVLSFGSIFTLIVTTKNTELQAISRVSANPPMIQRRVHLKPKAVLKPTKRPTKPVPKTVSEPKLAVKVQRSKKPSIFNEACRPYVMTDLYEENLVEFDPFISFPFLGSYEITRCSLAIEGGLLDVLER